MKKYYINNDQQSAVLVKKGFIRLIVLVDINHHYHCWKGESSKIRATTWLRVPAASLEVLLTGDE